MKISIERDILLKSLNHIQSVVERRNTIPILSNVKVISSDSGISLTATDLDLEIIENLEKANTLESGIVTTSAHTLYDIVRKLPEGSTVDISTKENDKLELSCGQSNFELSTLPEEDFPEMSSGEMPCNFVIGCDEMANMIDKSKFAISTEETRYYLNGIFLHAINGELRSVATDGHRLACIQSKLPAGADDIPSVIIPRKTIGEVRKLIEDTEGNINLSVSDTKIKFELTDIALTSKLIDGTFPDYERVIPKTNTKVMEVKTKDFASSIDRVATISSDKSKAVKFAIENNSLILTVTNPDAGVAVEKLEVSYESDDLEVGFNARYLLDISSQIEGDKMIFTLEDPGAPALIKDSAHEDATYVLMPMRV